MSIDDFSPFPKNPIIAKFFIQLGRVDELGSGVINVNKFIKEYSGQSDPAFIEGKTFKMTIPLAKELSVGAIDGTNVGAVVGAIAGVTDGVKEKLAILLKTIISNEGKRIPEYHEITQLGSERTLERYIQQLRDAKLIEFIGGAAQTGGYYLTELLKEKLK